MKSPASALIGLWLSTSSLACSVDSSEGMTSLTSSSSAGSFTSMSEADSGAEASTTDASNESADTQADGSDDTGDGDADSSSGDGNASSSGDGDSSSGDGDSSSGDGDSSSGDGDGDSSTSSTTGGGSPLDPDLDVPPEGNTPCTTPGSLSECPSTQVCRFYDTESGRCESCDSCGNLNAFCNEGTDCDILFSCYQNTCTNFCTLGTYECGPIDACIDIGHPTRGVCAP